jgi:hypothetical protein
LRMVQPTEEERAGEKQKAEMGHEGKG